VTSSFPAAGPAPTSNNHIEDRLNRIEAQMREQARSNSYTIKRADGSTAFEVSALETGETFWAFFDSLGNVIASEDAVSGKGLARPWIPIQCLPNRAEVIPLISGASFVSTGSSGDVFRVQQPKLDIQSLIRTTGGAAGEVQYKINGAVQGSVMAVGVDQFTWSAVQTVDLTDAIDTVCNVTVECRVTNGVGQIGALFVATQRQA
jgi:hypothetical protein